MKGEEQRYCIILVEKEDERKETELQVETEDGIKTENDESKNKRISFQMSNDISEREKKGKGKEGKSEWKKIEL
jgi:hypothetical protein